jgi:hypothetical protein
MALWCYKAEVYTANSALDMALYDKVDLRLFNRLNRKNIAVPVN